MSDYCYSFPVFTRVFAQAELMDRMMAKSGVDPLAAIRCDGGVSWYEARTRCIDCVSDKECRAWLEAAPAEPTPAASDFCPNDAFFRACREGKP